MIEMELLSIDRILFLIFECEQFGIWYWKSFIAKDMLKLVMHLQQFGRVVVPLIFHHSCLSATKNLFFKSAFFFQK